MKEVSDSAWLLGLFGPPAFSHTIRLSLIMAISPVLLAPPMDLGAVNIRCGRKFSACGL